MRSFVFFFFIIVSSAFAKENRFLPVLEEKLEEIFTEYAGYVTNWFRSFNEDHLGKTEMGRFLHYDELQMKLVENKNPKGRGMKKMGTAVMPLVFHIGAASTWMLLTTLLTAKTLAVGLALLVFKIAASSAKLASFFTTLKNSKEEHHDWTPAWTPHYEHHDYHIEHQPEHHDIQHHHIHEYKNSEYHNSNTQYSEYKTIPTHDMGYSDYHGDFNNSEGFKKSVDNRLG